VTRAFVGLGANLGDRVDTLQRALLLLDQRDGIAVAAVSSAYQSAPWGPVEQPPYLNAATELGTSLGPHELLRQLLAVEAELGRVRDVRWGPRTCDLDLLLYGGETIATADLQVPHPRLGQRRFVLDPLLELDSGLELPDGTPLSTLAAAVAEQEVERRPAIRLWPDR
jgi:2-amino-4-hydroxy-6-hydroxymethyldihydropteridine diphosphokinase